VAAWRGRQLGRKGYSAYRRALTGGGADRSGLTHLTYAVMLNYAADAATAVALANTLFFSAATGESKSKVALYLLITVAPFALVAPVIGPLLDRLQHGRRFALASSFVARAVLAAVMAQHFNDWLLYPAALGGMVLSKSFGVLKAAVTPRVLPPDATLVAVNSRLGVFGLAAGGVFGGVAGGAAAVFGSPGALWFASGVSLLGCIPCLRIPKWVESTRGEVPASLRGSQALVRDPALSHEPGRAHRSEAEPEPATVPAGPTTRARQPMGRRIVVSLWGNGSIRVLTGFLTLFVAFVVKSQTEHAPGKQLFLLGIVGAAAGIGSFVGTAIGAKQGFDKPDQVTLSCLLGTLAGTVLAALMPGLATVAVAALVGAVTSSLAKVSLDAVVQRDMPEESRASAFGRSETILQLTWVFGGALGVLLPPVYWLGFTIVAVLLAVGAVQTWLAHRGSSLIPGIGGDRPLRPPAFVRGGWRRLTGSGRPAEPTAPADRPWARQDEPAAAPGANAAGPRP
jgi:MFS family permease